MLTHEIDEELIKHGWDEDVWFHADNLSSAHIYVRLPEGEDWEKMNKGLLTDCAQLTKANSIEGNKKDNVTIVYTPWSNLKKDGSMAVGQVGFKDQRKVSTCNAGDLVVCMFEFGLLITS
jgi:predicted ribosome quality control (RQC) complex YloA/Tae2 family protein